MTATIPNLLVALLAPAFTAQGGAPGPGPTAQVLVVDAAGGAGAAFTDLQPAVDAAGDGDIVLVRSGTYSAFTVDAKRLFVQAEAGAHVVVRSPDDVAARVLNLAAEQWVVLRGLELEGGTLGGGLPPLTPSHFAGFEAADDAGAVWLEDCDVLGTAGGAVLRDCESVVLSRCSLRAEDLGGQYLFLGLPGGSGLEARDTRAHLFSSTLSGGSGSSFEGLSAYDGGHGARVVGGVLFAAACSFAGGIGGYSGIECAHGGHGLLLADGDPEVWTQGSSFVGGASIGGFCTTAPGLGVLVQSGTHRTIGAAPLGLRASSPVREGERVDLTLEGPPGAFVFLAVGRGPQATFRAPLHGVELVARPRQVLVLGRIPSSGVLEARTPIVPLRGSGVFTLQAAYVLGGLLVLGEASTVVALAPPF